jgi:gamma-glutamyl hercynylcysteine S-oxide synthase
MKKLLLLVSVFLFTITFSQNLDNITINNTEGFEINSLQITDNKTGTFEIKLPLFSFHVDDSLIFSDHGQKISNNEFGFFYNKIKIEVKNIEGFDSGKKFEIKIKNISNDTLKIENVVPLCESEDHIYITSTGQWALARAKLFRPDYGAINVTLPDNAWEMGYSSVSINEQYSVCAIARRKKSENAKKHRYKTIVYPYGHVTYDIYLDIFNGEWQNGLKLMFQKRFLFDLENFDNTLYERADLKWIRNSYLMTLQFAWDHNYYDWQKNEYIINRFLKNPKYFGWYDIFGIWPTWPRLGVDERNQWDLYKDLPGGLDKMKEIVSEAAKNKTKFFIAFNPWDKSTRTENPYSGMASLINAIDADGVVLDTRGSSSKKLQDATDRVKSGVIMYSEGMAIPKDMPGIISGRVHDAIFLQPLLNLNKLIKPDFAIFRVCQLSQGRIHRETAISFFNGYGTEINTFAPGRPDWMDEEYEFLGKTIKILRENTSVFNSYGFTPLISSEKDSIWINNWPGKDKVLYTILSFDYKGYQGPLFKVNIFENSHFVSIWNHEEINPVKKEDGYYLPVDIKGFNKKWLNTRSEGNIECIAEFNKYINLLYKADSLILNITKGDRICLWTETPSYSAKPVVFNTLNNKLKLSEIIGRYEGKIIIQLFDAGELIDEKIIYRKPGKPALISKKIKTKTAKKAPKGMIEIPSCRFTFYSTNNDRFIPYPDNADSCVIDINKFFIDKFPVTNKEYYNFIQTTSYKPSDTCNFLKHWINGKYSNQDANKPVVYINLADAKAYAKWAGKRLPSEAEWQYAAQGLDGRKFPWGNEAADSIKCNYKFGKISDVDKYPKGASPFDVEDMVGNVWQLTNDVYDNGSYYFVMIRGGSYYFPASSWWYVQGGPQELNKRQMLLLVSPGFDRNATVGFRCVVDAKS